jgi:hypothetical protein
MNVLATRFGTASSTTTPVEFARLQRVTLPIAIKGITPLIPHKWSTKARRMMPGGPDHGLKVKGKREPEVEAAAALYTLPDGAIGMPATAFKAAMVSACRLIPAKLTMTEAKLLFFVEGIGPDQLVPIEFGGRELREDTPRNSDGGADLRYRFAFFPWQAVVRVRFLPSSITPDSVANLLDAAGAVGIGDWRPGAPKSATGTFGQFQVDEDQEWEIDDQGTMHHRNGASDGHFLGVR